MAIQELDELFGMLSTPEDRQALEQLLERNAPATEYIKSGGELYKAFGEGDPAALARVQAKATARVATPPISPTAPAAVSTPAFDMTKIDELVTQRTRDLLSQLLETDTFTGKVKGLVKSTADELAPGMYERSMRNADELYNIKRSHEREFRTDLDMTKFNEFITANQGKFATLTDSHNAFVNEERIQARIAKGISDARAAEVTNQVPGGTLGKATQPSMADRFVSVNKTKVDTDRGTGMDQAAQALRRLQTASVE